MVFSAFLFVLGLGLLIKGGDWFVSGAAGIARRFHLPDIIVGATVVSIGTTLPEVMVSVTGALNGQGSMAYGNAIGSIICNTALIAALSVAIHPCPVNARSLTVPVLFFFMSAAVFCLGAYVLGGFPRWLGFILLGIFALYLFVTVLQSARAPVHNEKSDNKDYSKIVVVDKGGTKYVTGSESFGTSLSDIVDEMVDAGEGENITVEVYRKDSKNYKGKQFITCSIV